MREVLFVFLLTLNLFGQTTYQLIGKGYVAGMSYVTTLNENMKIENSNSSDPEINSYMLIHRVDVVEADPKTGKIVEAIVEISGDYDKFKDENMVPPEYLNVRLQYKRKWNGWDIYLGGEKITGKAEEALSDIEFSENFNGIPIKPVPIGYKWSIPLSEALKMMGNSTKEFSEIAKNASGQTKFIFKKIIKVDDIDCAQIDMNSEMKISIPEQGSMIIKGDLHGFRRLDYGITSHSEGIMEIKGAGITVRMTLQSSTKIAEP